MSAKRRGRTRIETATAVPGRSFTSESWWNKPFPSDLPIHPSSKAWTAAQAKVCHPPTLGNPAGGWAMPYSEAVKGATATITDGHTSVKIDIDVHVGTMAGDDAAIVFRDLARGIEINTFETVLTRNADGTVNLSKPIRCTGYSIYNTTSNGLARQVGGIKQNTGHRGIVPSSRVLRVAEIGALLSRKSVALGQPGDHPIPNFPMYGGESPRNGAIPEGMTIRYHGPITNPILQAAHDFGFIIGDTGGPGTATLKTVQGGDYRTPAEQAANVPIARASILHALDNTTWDQWDVMQAGWR